MFGLAPALHTARRDLPNPMREAEPQPGGGVRQALCARRSSSSRSRCRSCCSPARACCCGRSSTCGRVELGRRRTGCWCSRAARPAALSRAARRIAFFQDLLPRIEHLPGVEAVALNSGLHPLGNMSTPAEVVGDPAVSDPVQAHHVSADYTRTLGIRLAAGRLLTEPTWNPRTACRPRQRAVRANAHTGLPATRPGGRAVAAEGPALQRRQSFLPDRRRRSRHAATPAWRNRRCRRSICRTALRDFRTL